MSNDQTEQPPIVNEPRDLIACFHGARTAVVLCLIYFAIVWFISGGPYAMSIFPGFLLTLLVLAAAWGAMGGAIGLIVARTPNTLVAIVLGAMFAAVGMYGYSVVRGSQELPIGRAPYYGIALVGSISAAMAKRTSLASRSLPKKWTFSILDASIYMLLAAVCLAWIGEEFRESSSRWMIFRAGGRIVWTSGTWGIDFRSQMSNQQRFEESKLKGLAPALRRFTNLRLRLDNCKLSSVGVKELETLPNLKLILIDPSMYSEEEVQELRDRLTHVKIETDSGHYSFP